MQGKGAVSARGGAAPLPARVAVGRASVVKEPRWWQGRLFWLEQRPHERGRTTLMARTAAGAAAVELTPGSWNLRSRVHEYGGGAYTPGATAAGQVRVVFVHDGDRCLWCLDPDDPATAPWRLTEPAERAFADGLIDGARERWIGVMESGGRDRLVAVPLAGGEPRILREAADFCGYATLAPAGDRLAWVEWEQPFMPWQRSQLWLARLEGDGSLGDGRMVAGSGTRAGEAPCSVFQPLWLPGGNLVVANDRRGWWNLELLPAAAVEAALAGTVGDAWIPLLPMEAEFAMPQWVYGMRTTAWDGAGLVAAACRQGRWELGHVVLSGPNPRGGEGRWEPIACPFDDLAALAAEDGRLVAVASSPTTGPGLLVLETTSGLWSHEPAGSAQREAPPALPLEAISRPQAFWFEGHGGLPTHAWYYPPQGGAGAEAPLLVKCHSGPTGMARTGLSLAIQFWTSRGWGVVDVNYGGSTGFGRAYRERLDGLWGVVDVADCAAAARALVAAGWAGAERIAIEGGSAGGFTVLAALCFTDAFRAGACRYAVADPSALATASHRFEARYFDSLLGPWPQARAVYEERSPLLHAGRIRCPVVFFQGLDDRVVPPEQTERMALALSDGGVPVEVHRFAGEGHGFRSDAVQIQVLEATEAFFRRHLGL